MKVDELLHINENLDKPVPYDVNTNGKIDKAIFTVDNTEYQVMSYNGDIPAGKCNNVKNLKFSSITIVKDDGNAKNMNASKNLPYATAASILSTVVDFCVKHVAHTADLIFIKPYDDDEEQLEKKKTLYKGIAYKLIHKWGRSMYPVPKNNPIAYLVSKTELTDDDVINLSAYAQEDKFQ